MALYLIYIRFYANNFVFITWRKIFFSKIVKAQEFSERTTLYLMPFSNKFIDVQIYLILFPQARISLSWVYHVEEHDSL